MEQIEQGSPEWLALRAGKITASRISDLMAKTAGGKPSASRANYIAELVCERLTGQSPDFYVNDAMRRGTELEPIARDSYSFITGNDVEQVAFVDHPTIADAGCSPDGLVGDDGLVEIKCVASDKHIALLLGGKPEAKYVDQVQWQMACTGRAWADLTYYDDRLPVELRLHIVRIARDDDRIAEMEREVVAALNEVAGKVAALKSLTTKEAA